MKFISDAKCAIFVSQYVLSNKIALSTLENSKHLKGFFQGLVAERKLYISYKQALR